MVRQVLLVRLTLVGAWISPPATVTQGHHPPRLRSLLEIVVSERRLGLAIESGATPSAFASILTLSEAARRHAPRVRAAWGEQALPC